MRKIVANENGCQKSEKLAAQTKQYYSKTTYLYSFMNPLCFKNASNAVLKPSSIIKQPIETIAQVGIKNGSNNIMIPAIKHNMLETIK